jgi:nucleotide-binding universal stress UspA family protein
MFENMLLAVDGSEHSLNAARTASNLANAMNSQTLRIVVAYDPIPAHLGDPYMQDAINARMGETEEIIEEPCRQWETSPAQIHTEMIEGNPAEMIIEVARTRSSDVIIMGSRGLGNWLAGYSGAPVKKWFLCAPVLCLLSEVASPSAPDLGERSCKFLGRVHVPEGEPGRVVTFDFLRSLGRVP